jgi:hypothetical protein
MPIFDGEEITQADDVRLLSQLERIVNLTQDKKWRTLTEIRKAVNAPEASVSAALRSLRKKKFGGHTVNRRRRGDPTRGLWEYQVILQP